ncbi:MAG: dihydrodipicolinate reductase C-terminal domain-containing protein [Veillonella parvula]
MHAVRGGSIVGDHDVIFAGKDEIIEINHHAASKEIFAAGAVKPQNTFQAVKRILYNERCP